MVSGVPWFLPGVAVSFGVSMLIGPWAAKRLHAAPLTAGLLVFSLGMIASATLTPIGPELDGDRLALTCDFSRMGFAPLRDLLRLGDTSLNVVLFVPLGVAVRLIPDPTPRRLLLLLAAALPFAIETLQRLAPILARGCESADVIDNLTGLAIGFAGATVVLWLRKAKSPGRGSDPA